MGYVNSLEGTLFHRDFPASKRGRGAAEFLRSGSWTTWLSSNFQQLESQVTSKNLRPKQWLIQTPIDYIQMCCMIGCVDNEWTVVRNWHTSIHHPSIIRPYIHPSIHTQVSPLKGVYATVPWRQHSAPRMHRAQQEKRLIGGGFKDFVSPKFGSLGGNDAIWLTIVFWLFV